MSRTEDQPSQGVFLSPGADPRLSNGWVALPKVVLYATTLSALAKVFYGLLLDYTWQPTPVWLNQERLAGDAGCSTQTVAREIAALQHAGVVRLHRRGLHQPNAYELLPVPKTLDHTAQTGATAHLPSVVEITRGVFFTPGTDPRVSGGWVAVPKVILRATLISAAGKVMYGILLDYAWKDNGPWPDHAALGHDAGCSERNARRHLEELRVHALIRVHRRGLTQPNTYEILPVPEDLQRATNRPPTPDRTNLIGLDRTDMSDLDRTDLAGSERTNLIGLDRTPLSTQEGTDLAGQERTTLSSKIDSGIDRQRDNNRGHENTHVVVPPQESGAASAPATSSSDGLVADLRTAAPDLSARAAAKLVSRYSEGLIAERLAWLKVESRAAVAQGTPITSPAAWLHASVEWTTPPASFRRWQKQIAEEQQREQRAQARRAAEDQKAQDSQQRDAQVCAALSWFQSLPVDEQQTVDVDARARISRHQMLSAIPIPPVPAVLTAHGPTAGLWRDEVTRSFLDAHPDFTAGQE